MHIDLSYLLSFLIAEVEKLGVSASVKAKHCVIAFLLFFIVGLLDFL